MRGFELASAIRAFDGGIDYAWLRYRRGSQRVPQFAALRRAGLASHRYRLWLKRAFDLVVALAALFTLSPLLLATAVAVRLGSEGSSFFRQERTGLDGKKFAIWKFRTMYADRMDATGVSQTRTNDPRVTPLGRFLRRTNIDELPQLLNVVTGDMSLIGPRPHVPGMLAGGRPYEALVSYYGERHSMRPGLTGLAQMNALRGSTADPAIAKARIDYDIAYIENWSLRLDLYIFFKTLRSEFLRCSGS